MNLGVFFCLLLAHFIVDFPLQTKKIIALKNETGLLMRLKGNGLHTAIYFVVSIVIAADFWSADIFLSVAVISITHGILDFIKSFAILKRPFWKNRIDVFLLDQAIHIMVICFVFYYAGMNSSASPMLQMQIERIIDFFVGSAASITYSQKLILSIVLLTIGLWGVGVFIRILFNGIKLKPYANAINLKLNIVVSDKYNGADDGGFTIGLLERLFIIISIVLNIPLVIGFILTAKSVARLKKFDDDCFVEIFIIGSFISFICAIVIGYMIKALKVLPY